MQHLHGAPAFLLPNSIAARVKMARMALNGTPMTPDVTCHMGSLSVTCHPTQVNAPALTPASATEPVGLLQTTGVNTVGDAAARCRGHIPTNILVGWDVNENIPQYYYIV